MDNSSEPNPWCPWYDKIHGLVIRAENEKQARELATSVGRDEITNDKGQPDAWMDSRLSSCVELTRKGGAEIILVDSRSG